MSLLHILLAEDNRGDVLLVRQALVENGIQHELHVVQDGEQALRFVARMGKPGEPPCPDIFLLDLNLPRVDGPQVLREFRRHSECTETPVIVVTSSDAPKDRGEMAALGVTRYFKKPTDLDAYMELGAVVLEAVAGKSK
jgi:CheY-like chemotaxis protein